jgi:Protein of unknown function, DUF547
MLAERPKKGSSVNKCLLLLLSMLVVFTAGCASVPRPSSIQSIQAPPLYQAWASVLAKHVDGEGRINFDALAKDRSELDQFVAYVYDNGPNNRPEFFRTPQSVLAFHINAYNALAMHKVLESGIPQTLAGFKKVTFFAFGKVQVGGQKISLYDYENRVIRSLGDPRIHVALNCMSVSCPRLPKEVFLPENVDALLDRESIRFFSEPRNVALDVPSKTVTLSEILKFYPGDFLAKAKSLIAYANLYRTEKVPEDYTVTFRPYDWTINRQPIR